MRRIIRVKGKGMLYYGARYTVIYYNTVGYSAVFEQGVRVGCLLYISDLDQVWTPL